MDSDKLLEILIELRNNKLLKARKRLGLTQKQLAKKAGVSWQLYGRAERMNMRDISDDFQWRIAKVLNVPVKELFPPWIRFIQRRKFVKLADLEDLPILESQVRGLMQETPLDPETYAIHKEEAFQILERLSILHEKRPDLAYAVKAHFLDGESIEAIGRHLGITGQGAQFKLNLAYDFIRKKRPLPEWDNIILGAEEGELLLRRESIQGE